MRVRKKSTTVRRKYKKKKNQIKTNNGGQTIDQLLKYRSLLFNETVVKSGFNYHVKKQTIYHECKESKT